jgi:CRISPR-associated protein Cst2
MEVVKMAYPVLTGAVLIEANGAALNNAGQAEGLRVENAIVVKQIRIGRLRFPYVSGQAWRRWWREVLYADFGWTPSEVTREAKSAYTKGDPIAYEEDDLFGYMAARKRQRGRRRGAEEGEEPAEGAAGTNRRISPLKNSLLVSVLPNVITNDFGHFSRNLPPDTDIIPFESEHYTTYLQGVFTISLSDVGRFVLGEMADLSEDIVNEHRKECCKKMPTMTALTGCRRKSALEG